MLFLRNASFAKPDFHVDTHANTEIESLVKLASRVFISAHRIENFISHNSYGL